MPSSGTVTVPATGGVEFSAQINGRGPFKLIFDTGAGVNILSATTAKQLGLHVEGDPLQVAGVGGYATVRRARVNTLRIGSLVLHDQTFYVMALPWEHRSGLAGAVGHELLSRLTVKIDYERQQLTFSQPLRFRTPAMASSCHCRSWIESWRYTEA
jgi:predicted aspartyl protease